VYFCTRDEATSAVAGQIRGQIAGIGERREVWQRQRQLAAPLTLGHPAWLVGEITLRIGARRIGGNPSRSLRPTPAIVGAIASLISSTTAAVPKRDLADEPPDSRLPRRRVGVARNRPRFAGKREGVSPSRPPGPGRMWWLHRPSASGPVHWLPAAGEVALGYPSSSGLVIPSRIGRTVARTRVAVVLTVSTSPQVHPAM
jgi:hypothetical protein